MKGLQQLPDNLPIPVDDGACDHLEGMSIPALLLKTSAGGSVDLANEKGTVVIFFYPMTGTPDSPPMIGWNEIPGARGCTPQTCAYRDHYSQLLDFEVKVFGASSQAIEEQQAAVSRLHLPYELINDANFRLTAALQLPTFEYQGVRMIKRLTLTVLNGVIRKVFYPVFPPDKDVSNVIAWLNTAPTTTLKLFSLCHYS